MYNIMKYRRQEDDDRLYMGARDLNTVLVSNRRYTLLL